MTGQPPSAESRLDRLIDRMLSGAETAIASGDFELAREMASDVLMVDPDNERAVEISRVADDRQRSRLGERTVMTIMFSDLVDSTPLAESEEPEIVRDVFSLYREEAKRAVERFGGRIINYLGDGVVASFGYPDIHEDDARRAVSAGLELLRGMESVAVQALERHGVDARVRVGIHTGLVVVADIGEGRATERDAIVGVTPNLAARIQAAAAPGEVVISDVTQHIVDVDFDLESMGAHALKGITREVELFRVTAARHVSRRLAADRYASPMVGRSEAAAKLRDCWDEAAAAVPTSPVLVVGPAGIGKSRLVADLRAHVDAAEGSLFEAGCLPYHTNSALWPVAEALKNFLGLAPDPSDDEVVATLVSALGEAGLPLDPQLALLAPLVGVDVVADHPMPELDPSARRQALLQALLALIGGGTGTKPRALIIEDAHWADPSTLDLLGLAIASAPPGLLVVATAREVPQTAWAGDVEVIALSSLDQTEAAHMVATVNGADVLDEASIAAIVERSEGIPLFVEELTRSAIAAGTAVPVRLQELLAARLRDPSVDLGLAQVAATVGVEFDGELIADLLPDQEVPARLSALEAAGIVDHVQERTGHRYRFRHALLRDTAYEMQVLEARRSWHGQIAGALLARSGDPAVVARHYDLGGMVVEALGQYTLAVQASQSAGAHEEATQLATRSLELIGQLPEGGERDFAELGMLMLRGLSVSSIRGYAAPEVGADFRRANVLSDKLGTAPEVMPAAFAIWSFALVAGDVPTAKLLADRLRERVQDGSGAWFGPEVDAALGYQALYEGDLAAADEAFARAMEAFAARPAEAKVSEYWPLPNDPIAITAVGRAVVTTLRGDIAGGQGFASEALARADEVPFPRGPFSMAFVKVYLAWIALLLGDGAGSQRLGEETSAIGQQYGYAYWMALGSIYHQVGDPDIEAFAGSMALLRSIGHEAFRASYMAYYASLQEAAGDTEAALETVHDALLEITKSGELLHRPDLVRMRGVLSLRTGGETAAAVADMLASLELAEADGNRIYALQAALDLARLPGDLRPTDWRDRLAAQVDAFDPSVEFATLDSARELLTAE